MSKLGNIYLSYGKELKISVANIYSNIVLSGSNLSVNSIIITSNIDDNFEDTGTYSLIATDNEGNPVRLTYCIKPGNGLNISDNNSDILELKIDNKSIKNTTSELNIDLSFINSVNLKTDNNILSVNTENFPTSSVLTRGILNIDGKTILSDEDTLFINTDSLNYSDNSTMTYGIVTYTDEILKIDNGIVSLQENMLPKASDNEYGVIISDNNTVSIEEGIINVNTVNLKHATENEFGIINVDNEKINVNEGILSVDTSKLNKATYSDIGTVCIDGNTIILNSDNQISIKNYDNIISGLNNLNVELSKEIDELNEIKNDILSQIK